VPNPYLILLLGSAIGVVCTYVAQLYWNRRGLFTYSVRHERIGLSADDDVFGTVRVTWNDAVVANLYSSTIELHNESLQDFQDVVVSVYTDGTTTHLLTESSHIVGTIHYVERTTEYATRLAVPAGGDPSTEQQNLYRRRRDYNIPTMNRGQVVRFVYLNSSTPNSEPQLWLDIVHKGVKLNQRFAQQDVLGVPAKEAALVGLVLGIGGLLAVILSVDTLWVGAALCLVLGFTTSASGALVIRSWRRLRNVIGG